MDRNSSVDAFTWLFVLVGTLLVSGVLGLTSSWQRLFWIARVGRSGQADRSGVNRLTAFLLSGIASAGPGCLLVGVAVVVCVPPVIPRPERIDAADLALRESMRAEIGVQT